MEISTFLILLILFTLLVSFVVSGMWVGVGVGVTGFICLALFSGVNIEIITAGIYKLLSSYSLAAMPLFIFMGQLVYHSGLIKMLYRGVSKWTDVLPGSLVHANILSCTLFAACTGSSVAGAATMGSIAYPEQVIDRGYNIRLVLGSVAAGGTLGILIPPSIDMIVYGSFCQESIGQLFLAGVIPGLITSAMFMVYIFLISLKNPNLVPVKREKLSFRYFANGIVAMKDTWPALVLIVFILGSIYGGICTPTEAGAMSVFIVLVMSAGFKLLTWDVLKKAALDAILMEAYIGLVLIGASVLMAAVAQLKIAVWLSETVASLGLAPVVVWVIAAAMYLVAGCFFSAFDVMIITLPIIHPLMTGLGFDGIWLGVMLTITVECGLITPPYGMNLFVLQGISHEKDIWNVALGSLPFFGIMVLTGVIFTAFPELVLWLPSKMFAGW